MHLVVADNCSHLHCCDIVYEIQNVFARNVRSLMRTRTCSRTLFEAVGLIDGKIDLALHVFMVTLTVPTSMQDDQGGC